LFLFPARFLSSPCVFSLLLALLFSSPSRARPCRLCRTCASCLFAGDGQGILDLRDWLACTSCSEPVNKNWQTCPTCNAPVGGDEQPGGEQEGGEQPENGVEVARE